MSAPATAERRTEAKTPAAAMHDKRLTDTLAFLRCHLTIWQQRDQLPGLDAYLRMTKEDGAEDGRANLRQYKEYSGAVRAASVILRAHLPQPAAPVAAAAEPTFTGPEPWTDPVPAAGPHERGPGDDTVDAAIAGIAERYEKAGMRFPVSNVVPLAVPVVAEGSALKLDPEAEKHMTAFLAASEAEPGECPSCGVEAEHRHSPGYVPGATGQPVTCMDDWHDAEPALDKEKEPAE